MASNALLQPLADSPLTQIRSKGLFASGEGDFLMALPYLLKNFCIFIGCVKMGGGILSIGVPSLLFLVIHLVIKDERKISFFVFGIGWRVAPNVEDPKTIYISWGFLLLMGNKVRGCGGGPSVEEIYSFAYLQDSRIGKQPKHGSRISSAKELRAVSSKDNP
ncbi:hypothetical protein CJ030_MR6G016548 [Morella rubra]|uniref:Uncharacterized protein n=1 Tax=Morella rubra TaxID=262757 RepID=A0A6A1V913_9ROSI|nr:hypothetical protein CJ030_MR6G016548 [Morella rubra]